jgi:hypothetical protein
LGRALSTPHFPGWYPDPERPGRERLWNGHAWTDHLRRTADQGRLSPRTIVAAAGAGVVGLVLLLVVGVVAGGVDDGVTADPPTSQAPASSPLQQTPTSPTPTTAATPTSEPTPTARPSPSLVKVPAVEGLGLVKAKRELRAASLKVGEVDRRPSSKSKGTVLKQGVAEGTQVKPGSSVPLVVAAPLPRVPSVVGKSEASAIRNLKNAGFKVKKTTRTRTTGQDGVVLSQSPSGGTRARPNSLVRIVISNVERRPDDGGTGNCTPGYSPCLPPASDYDCSGGSGNGPKYVDGPVRVTGSDPYDLDRDGDGVGCQS